MIKNIITLLRVSDLDRPLGGVYFLNIIMNKSKAQEWFLIKKNWMVELKDLSNEEFGLLVRSLYTSGAPEGTLKMIYGLLKDEYDRVNEKREEGLLKRRQGSLKAVEARKNKTSGITSGEPQVNRTHTHTSTLTDTPIGESIQSTITKTGKEKAIGTMKKLNTMEEFDKVFE